MEEFFDRLSGFCDDGTTRLHREEGVRIIELLKTPAQRFPQVISDARFALAVVEALTTHKLRAPLTTAVTGFWTKWRQHDGTNYFWRSSLGNCCRIAADRASRVDQADCHPQET